MSVSLWKCNHNKAHDAAQKEAAAIATGEATDWRKAMEEWEKQTGETL